MYFWDLIIKAFLISRFLHFHGVFGLMLYFQLYFRHFYLCLSICIFALGIRSKVVLCKVYCYLACFVAGLRSLRECHSFSDSSCLMFCARGRRNMFSWETLWVPLGELRPCCSQSYFVLLKEREKNQCKENAVSMTCFGLRILQFQVCHLHSLVGFRV